MASRALTLVHNQALTVQRDADVYRLASIVLSVLDRLSHEDTHEISRIRVIGRRVVVFDLPFLIYDPIVHRRLGAMLTSLVIPRVIAIRHASTGSLIIFDLKE